MRRFPPATSLPKWLPSCIPLRRGTGLTLPLSVSDGLRNRYQMSCYGSTWSRTSHIAVQAGRVRLGYIHFLKSLVTTACSCPMIQHLFWLFLLGLKTASRSTIKSTGSRRKPGVSSSKYLPEQQTTHTSLQTFWHSSNQQNTHVATCCQS